jgi:ElaB/YqjD/DUF883 family membrane-anchored ribosome-binding protein
LENQPLKAALDQTGARLMKAGQDAVEAVEDMAKAKPAETLVLALGTGFLLGVLCRAGHRR